MKRAIVISLFLMLIPAMGWAGESFTLTDAKNLIFSKVLGARDFDYSFKGSVKKDIWRVEFWFPSPTTDGHFRLCWAKGNFLKEATERAIATCLTVHPDLEKPKCRWEIKEAHFVKYNKNAFPTEAINEVLSNNPGWEVLQFEKYDYQKKPPDFENLQAKSVPRSTFQGITVYLKRQVCE